MSKITIFKIQTNGISEIKEIDNTLEAMQHEVGGLIERIAFYDELEEKNIDMWADDEGLLKADPIISFFITDKEDRNKVLQPIVGDIFFASCDDEGETTGLTTEQLTFILRHLRPVSYKGKSDSETDRRQAFTFWF